MGETRFRAAAPETLLRAPLDLLTAVYHRASGTTHLLAEPAPELLAALADDALTRGELMARLGEQYAVAEADELALAARLDELVAAGLVTASSVKASSVRANSVRANSIAPSSIASGPVGTR